MVYIPTKMLYATSKMVYIPTKMLYATSKMVYIPTKMVYTTTKMMIGCTMHPFRFNRRLKRRIFLFAESFFSIPPKIENVKPLFSIFLKIV